LGTIVPDAALRGPGRFDRFGPALRPRVIPRSLRWATLVIDPEAFPGRPDACALIPLE